MKLVFDELYSPSDLTGKTRRYYARFGASTDVDEDFKNIYEISYKLVFGSMDKETSLLILLQKYYRNEYYIKALVKKQFPSLVFTSELPVIDRRADLIGVSGHSDILTCYEIKTRYDSLARLQYQVQTYARCFSLNYVVCSEDKVQTVLDMVPDFVGVLGFKNRSNCALKQIRKAQKSPFLEKSMLAECLSKKSLKKFFDTEDRAMVVSDHSLGDLQRALKSALYAKHPSPKHQWQFPLYNGSCQSLYT